MRRLALILLLLGMGMTGTIAQQTNSTTIPEELTTLWRHVSAQPEDFAVACMPLQNRGATVLHNGDSFPLASVSKLLIFIEYAIRVDAGTIPLDATVSAATLARYNLPRTDRGAHDRFMEIYPADVTALSLWDVATEGMIQYSSNAASDYLLDYMAPVDWEALYSLLGVYDTTVPHALTMIPLLMNNHDTGRADEETLTALSIEQGEDYLDLYIQDESWRQEEVSYRNQRPIGERGWSSTWPDWEVQAAILQQHTATGNVNDFRNVMDAIYSENSPLNPNVRYMVRTALQWTGNEFIAENYVEYGSKLGYYSGGVLTLVAYGEPYNGQPVISVIFLRNITRPNYRDLLDEDSIGNFAHWMHFNACTGLSDLLDSIG